MMIICAEFHPINKLSVSLSALSKFAHARFLTGCAASLYYISQCLSVCYRFSRQPLIRLLWNLTRCLEMKSERQLIILVSIGCIFNELSHMRFALYWARISFGTATVTWQWFGFTFINALSSALSDVKHLGILLFDVNALTGYGRRATGDKISCFDRF